MGDWSDEENDDPHDADRRNFYKVEKWTSAVLVHFSEGVFRALGREQVARLGKRDPSPLARWQC